MEPSRFSDTQSSHKSRKSKENMQYCGSATKSEGAKMIASWRLEVKKTPDSKEQIKSLSSGSYLLKSLLGSEEDLYTPTKASSHCEEQYEEDRKSDIEEMRELVKENKQTLRSFYCGKSYQQARSSCSFNNQKAPNVESCSSAPAINDNRQLLIKVCVFVVLLIFFGALYKYGSITQKEEAISTLGNGLSSCWDNFKKENCDLNNPVGPFCKKLLQCTLNKQNPDKEKIGKSKESESLIEEFCGLGVVSAFIYLFGVNNTMRFFIAIFKFLKRIYDLKKEESEARKSEPDTNMDNQ